MAVTETALFELPPPSRKVWVFAALVAIVLHAGIGGFLLWELQDDDEDTDLGAPALAIGIDLASPRFAPSSLPPGPEAEATAAAQAAVEQKPTTVQPELPKETPTVTENADRLVTLNDVTKPTEEETPPDTAVKQVTPSDESVAQEATALPSVETPVEAAQSTTVDQGTAASRRRAALTWQREMAVHLDRHKRYPAERLQRDVETIVDLELDRTGRVKSVTVVQSSGHAAFDEAAIAWVQRASPLPMPPPLVADEGLTFRLPMRFTNSRRD